jgi:hypothetical protein
MEKTNFVKVRRATPDIPDLLSLKIEKKRAKQPLGRTKPGKQLFGSDLRPKHGPGRPRGATSFNVYARLAYEGIARAVAMIGRSNDLAVGLAEIFRKGDQAIQLKILDIFSILAEKRTPAMISDEELAVLGQQSGTGQGVHIHLHGMPGVPAPDGELSAGNPSAARLLSTDFIDVIPMGVEKEKEKEKTNDTGL